MPVFDTKREAESKRPPTRARLSTLPRRTAEWRSKLYALVQGFGRASRTVANHRTAEKQFNHFRANVLEWTWPQVRASQTDALAFFAIWLNERPVITVDSGRKWSPLSAKSSQQYVGRARAAHKTAPGTGAARFDDVDDEALEVCFTALARREAQTGTRKRMPPKIPMTKEHAEFLAASAAYATVKAAILSGRPMPRMTHQEHNEAMASAAAIVALAHGLRKSSTVCQKQGSFNHFVNASAGDVTLDSDGWRMNHKPTKADFAGDLFDGPGPWYPATPSSDACPHMALRVRAALAKGENASDPMFTTVDRFGLRRPMTTAQLKKLAFDRLLHLCPAGSTTISPRHGAASAIVNAGISEPILKIHGKWKSDAWKSYAHLSTESSTAVMTAIFGQTE